MISFYRLLEAMEGNPLMDAGDEDAGVSTARSGMNLRGDGDDSFWDDFVSLCGNNEGLATLLGVRPEQVASWPSRIRRALDTIRRHDQQEKGDTHEPETVLPTGDNGAMTASKMAAGPPSF